MLDFTHWFIFRLLLLLHKYFALKTSLTFGSHILQLAQNEGAVNDWFILPLCHFSARPSVWVNIVVITRAFGITVLWIFYFRLFILFWLSTQLPLDLRCSFPFFFFLIFIVLALFSCKVSAEVAVIFFLIILFFFVLRQSVCLERSWLVWFISFLFSFLVA